MTLHAATSLHSIYFLRPIQGPALASTTHFDIQSSKTLATSILSKNKPGLRLISLFKVCASIHSEQAIAWLSIPPRSVDFFDWLGAVVRGGLRPISTAATTPGEEVVGLGGLEPPTSPLSGARSNHLSYRPKAWSNHSSHIWWSLSGSNRRPPACKAGALPAELKPRQYGTRTHQRSKVKTSAPMTRSLNAGNLCGRL